MQVMMVIVSLGRQLQCILHTITDYPTLVKISPKPYNRDTISNSFSLIFSDVMQCMPYLGMVHWHAIQMLQV